MHFVYDSLQVLRVAMSMLRDHGLGCTGVNDNPERMIILTVHLAWTCMPPVLFGAHCVVHFDFEKHPDGQLRIVGSPDIRHQGRTTTTREHICTRISQHGVEDRASKVCWYCN